jgi:hypothetical protein
MLRIEPHGVLLARLSAAHPLELEVRVAARSVGKITLSGRSWDEIALELPADIATGRQAIELAAPSRERFTALHYWSYSKALRAVTRQ